MKIYFNKLFPGKLPPDFLHELISQYTGADEATVVGSGVGEDATVIDIGDRLLLAKTDPVTFVTDQIGYYAVHVNANDIYCMGGRPRWFLATVLLPERTSTRSLATEIFQQISRTCKQEKITYCGGHTEVTMGLDRPIVIGQMLGEVEKERLLHKALIRTGDSILLANPIPIEATAIMGRTREREIARAFSEDFVKRCKELLKRPGLSVGPAAKAAVKAAAVNSLHDVTEGGLATALHEIARAAHLGLEIRYEAIPLLAEGKLLCDHFGLDPLGCIGSGSLLIVCPKSSVISILSALENTGIPAAEIGCMLDEEYGVGILHNDGPTQKLPLFTRDEIIKIFPS